MVVSSYCGEPHVYWVLEGMRPVLGLMRKGAPLQAVAVWGELTCGFGLTVSTYCTVEVAAQYALAAVPQT